MLAAAQMVVGAQVVFGNLNFDTVATGVLTRGEIAYKLTPRATLRTGYDVLFAPYTSTARLPASRRPSL